MILNDVLKSSKAVTELSQKHLSDFAAAYAIANLKKAVDSDVEFFVNEEKKMAEKYAKKDENGKPMISQDGRITFVDVKDANSFNEEHIKLANTESTNVHRITVNPKCFIDSKEIPTPEQILLLEPVVAFSIPKESITPEVEVMPPRA